MSTKEICGQSLGESRGIPPFQRSSAGPWGAALLRHLLGILALVILCGSPAWGLEWNALTAPQQEAPEGPQAAVAHARILGFTGTSGTDESILVTQPKHLDLLSGYFIRSAVPMPAADKVGQAVKVRFIGMAPRNISLYPDTNTWSDGEQTFAMTPDRLRDLFDLIEELWIERFCAEADPNHLTVVVHDLESVRAAPRTTLSLRYETRPQGTPFNDECAMAIADRFPFLLHLNIPEARAISEEGFQHLGRIASLQSLRVRFAESKAASRRAAVALGALPQLRVLDVSYSPGFATDAALRQLALSSSLEHMVLVQKGPDTLTGEVLPFLASKPQLKSVLVGEKSRILTDLNIDPQIANSAPVPLLVAKERPEEDFYTPLFQDRTRVCELIHKRFLVERAERVNERVYMESRAVLQAVESGRWVAIVDGILLSSYDTMKGAAVAADRINPDPDHRYLFRPGIDDVAESFATSPWANEPNWWQVGVQFRSDHNITVSSKGWSIGARAAATFSGRAAIQLESPVSFGQQTDVKLRASPAITRYAVASGMLEQQLTITDEDYLDLNLHLYSIPGEAQCLSFQTACRRTRVVLAISHLELHELVVAFVMPTLPQAPRR